MDIGETGEGEKAPILGAIDKACRETVNSNIYDHMEQLGGKAVDIEFVTSSECSANSHMAAELLRKEYPELLRHIFCLRGDIEDAFKRNENWTHHEMAVCQDMDGKWYAFSPANFSYEAEENLLKLVYRAGDLETLLKIIQEKEGGKWASAEAIEDGLGQTVPSLPLKRFASYMPKEAVAAIPNEYVEIGQNMINTGDPNGISALRKIVDVLKK
jgi:hypothetical protein